MRKLGIALISLLLMAILFVSLFSAGLLPFPLWGKDPAIKWEFSTLLQSSKEESLEYTLSAKPALAVKNALGNITVEGAEESELIVTLTKRTSAQTPKRAEELAEQIELEIQSTEESNYLIVRIPRTAQGEQAAADLKLLLPLETDLDLQAALGSISVRNIQGDLGAVSELGPITIVNYRGSALLEAHLGTITIENSHFQRRFKAITHLGDIHIEGSLAERNILESGLGNLRLILPPTEAYTLEGTIGMGEFSSSVSFKGQRSGNKILGIIGEGEERGTILADLELGSLEIGRKEKEGD